MKWKTSCLIIRDHEYVYLVLIMQQTFFSQRFLLHIYTFVWSKQASTVLLPRGRAESSCLLVSSEQVNCTYLAVDTFAAVLCLQQEVFSDGISGPQSNSQWVELDITCQGNSLVLAPWLNLFLEHVMMSITKCTKCTGILLKCCLWLGSFGVKTNRLYF